MHLLKALRSVARTEASAVREAVFRDIANRSAVIRIVLGVHRVLRELGLSHFMVAFYGVSYFVRAVLPAGRVRWVGIGLYPNEVKQLDDLDRIMGEGWGVSRIGWKLVNLPGIFALRARACMRVLRVVRRIDARYGFMPACRITVALFLYLRLKPWLAEVAPKAVVVASDYSPDGAALAGAAASLGIARVYMPHALPSSHIPGRTLLGFEAYVFDSEAMHARFASMGTIAGHVMYRGVRGAHRMMRLEGLSVSQPRIGIFLSGSTDMPALRWTIAGLNRLSPASILVRGHPVDFANPDFTGIDAHVSKGTTLEEDAASCDLILAGNTTAILETLRMGVPTVYYSKLDNIPYDYNGFVADGLVPDLEKITLLDLTLVRRFFSAVWEKRMRYFDAAYGGDVEMLHAHVRSGLMVLVGDA